MRSNALLADSSVNTPLQRKEDPPVHVLTLTPFFPSRENEISGCFVKESLDFLQGEGVTSTVIAVSPFHYPKRSSASQSSAEWVRYAQIPGTFGLSGAGRLLGARLSRSVADLHRRKPIDVIHAHGALPCGHAASILARRLRVPYVVTVHGLDVFNTCYVDGMASDWRRRASVAVYQGANTVVCISPKVQEILRDGMPEVSSCVIYNGANPDLFAPESNGSRQTVLSDRNTPQHELLIVGNLIPSKGQELVFRAIHRIASAFPELQCWVVGEGPDRARLEQLAAGLGIRNQIHFAARESRAEVADAMRRCSAFVLPSRNEGLGCVYLEAMACGKPVIGCRGQGIEEIIEHGKNGWLVSGDDVDELAQVLTTLLQSPELSVQIGRAARQTILDGLTLSHQAHNLATLYRAASVLAARDRAL
ncbi:MAG TPA: glycosyltransferase [Terriglobales bacterium]|nr:glycosyltransferase [Terriglobales bacterium]